MALIHKVAKLLQLVLLTIKTIMRIVVSRKHDLDDNMKRFYKMQILNSRESRKTQNIIRTKNKITQTTNHIGRELESKTKF